MFIGFKASPHLLALCRFLRAGPANASAQDMKSATDALQDMCDKRKKDEKAKEDIDKMGEGMCDFLGRPSQMARPLRTFCTLEMNAWKNVRRCKS